MRLQYNNIGPILVCFYTLFQLSLTTPLSTAGGNNNVSQFYSIDIAQWLDNKAFGEAANFDEFDNSFIGQLKLDKDILIQHNTNYKNNDNIKADGQKIPLPKEQLGALYMLVSASHGPMTVPVDIVYTDGTRDTTTLSLPDWQDDQVHQMERYQVIKYLTNVEQRKGALFNVPIFINPSKTPTFIILPNRGKNSYETMHVFSITAYRGVPMISSAQSTNEWLNTNEQVVSMKIHNTQPAWIQNVGIQLESGNIKTVKAGTLEALAPGHVHMVQVVVQHIGQQMLENVTVSLVYTENGVLNTKQTVVSLALQTSPDQFQATTESVQSHRSPTWLKQSKFGIFIHWGLFSVPAWAPVGKAYAEWYWWRMNHKDDDAFEYHREHYGEDFKYDDFLNQWKPTQFNPSTWLDLIDKSRAKYYVFTTKHHDGIALFDTNVTDRSTMHLLQPSRDFVKELLNVSESKYPHLKRGLYFSLPEWYHPKYSDDSLGWHGPPMNPYNNQRIAYRGSRTIDNFVNELQVPQFKELASNYNPDIIWCDIGGIHNSTVWQSDYFNNALKSGRQVAVNDRCGDGSASDFTTIEYKAVKDTPSRFWEATRGMDPFSFGYNRETKPEEYATTFSLIKDLVDAVSKGGNFLLNIGPEASGHIPEPMSQRLLEIGQWIDKVYASIFDSVPYWITSDQDDLRFTANSNGKSFYVFYCSSSELVNAIEIDTPLPIQKQSVIKLMNKPETKVQWQLNEKGNIELKFDLSPQEQKDMQIIVFDISMPL